MPVMRLASSRCVPSSTVNDIDATWVRLFWSEGPYG
jgi:hypothetical protein